MQNKYITDRLVLHRLKLKDYRFIKELVNSPGWLKFIGDRKIKTDSDAKSYIRKIIEAPKVNYWVVRLLDQGEPIGIVTCIKREYLKHSDIGFAFLSQYSNKGYAYEAASAVLRGLLSGRVHPKILATAIQGNDRSVRLLEKLGFEFQKEAKYGDSLLLVYSISAEAKS